MTHDKIITAGDLRGFLSDVLLDIRAGKIDLEEASSIAKVSAQINQSLAVEVNARLSLEKMGKGHPGAGSLMLTSGVSIKRADDLEDGGGVWCSQCEDRVLVDVAAGCKSRLCPLKATAV